APSRSSSCGRTPSAGRKGLSRRHVGRSELSPVGAAAGEDGRPAARGKGNGLLDRHAGAEREREARGKAVATAVRVLDRARDRRRAEWTTRADPAPERARRADLEAGRRVELDGVEP